jgi:recombination protein RecA
MSLEKLLKKYVFYTATEIPQVERLRSGIFVFDLITGGGIPLGRFTEFHGDKSTGKSTMSLRLANKYLKMFPDKLALYIDFELSYDPKWASYFVEDLKRLYVLQPDYGELGIDFIVNACKEPEVGFVIIDSIAAIVPTAEADSDMFTQFIGLQARIVNSMFRKLLPVISQAKRDGRFLTFILINQIRTKIDRVGYGNQITKPAGKMQDAVVSMDIRFYTKEYKKVGDIPVKIVHQVNVEKNKVGGNPKRTGQFEMYLTDYEGYKTGEVDNVGVIITIAKKVGLLIREGNKWKMQKREFKNLIEVKSFIREPKIREELSDYLLEKVIKEPQLLIEGASEEE